ncbi:MAG TPA: CTP synthase [Ignavibacteriaceae bacterium]|nr:CTP synthase [Ignavibacteriaceae bacterium]
MIKITIGLIGDHDPRKAAHQAIPLVLNLSAIKTGTELNPVWVKTDSIKSEECLKEFEGIWCVPGSPYNNMEGALLGIKYARENRIPFLGTCGGFQHAVIEYFRNVFQMKEAGHTEIDPAAKYPIIAQLSCSLLEKNGTIYFKEGALVSKIYRTDSAEEKYHCSYGFNPAYINLLRKSNLKISGKDKEGDIRVLELQNHPFFVLTLFQPERAGLRGEEHPLITAFVSAAINFNKNYKFQTANSK